MQRFTVFLINRVGETYFMANDYDFSRINRPCADNALIRPSPLLPLEGRKMTLCKPRKPRFRICTFTNLADGNEIEMAGEKGSMFPHENKDFQALFVNSNFKEFPRNLQVQRTEKSSLTFYSLELNSRL